MPATHPSHPLPSLPLLTHPPQAAAPRNPRQRQPKKSPKTVTRQPGPSGAGLARDRSPLNPQPQTSNAATKTCAATTPNPAGAMILVAALRGP